MEVSPKRRRRDSTSSNADGVDQLQPQEPASSAEDQSSDQSMLDAVGKTSARTPADVPIGCRENDAAADNIKKEALTTGSAKKKRHRRKHKAGEHHPGRNSGSGKWKPYDQLTWEERRKIDEKAMRRATTRREEQIASGQPMAPYNTTQFLMEQHDLEYVPTSFSPRPHGLFGEDGGVRVNDIPCRGDNTLSGSMSDDDDLSEEASMGEFGTLKFGSRENEQIFLEKDFSDAYESFRAERLQTMTKDELMREYLEMESRLDGVYARLSDLQLAPEDRSEVRITGGQRPGHDPVASLKEELLRLREENVKLAAENDQLKRIAQ